MVGLLKLKVFFNEDELGDIDGFIKMSDISDEKY
jgi:hypothetical protein